MMETEVQSSCGVCGGPLDANQPGNVRAENGDLEHAVCHERGAAPQEPIVSMNDGTKARLNLQYNCGHFAYGLINELPQTCPECGDEAA